MVVDYLPFSDFCSIRSINRRINYATVYLFARKYFRTFEVNFTSNSLQRLVHIANHCDIFSEVRFGKGVQHISLKQAMWSEQEGAARDRPVRQKGGINILHTGRLVKSRGKSVDNAIFHRDI
jgi:hypothetical protein